MKAAAPEPLEPGALTIPRELFDRSDPTWYDLRATVQWYRRHSVPIPDRGISTLARRRCGQAQGDWALSHGLESERWPGGVDWHKMAALGWGQPRA